MQFDNNDIEQVIELYNQGLSIREIAQKIRTSIGSTCRLINNLRNEGAITSERYTSKEKMAKQKHQIIEFYNQGLSYSEMADRLNLSESMIEYRILVLRKEGKISPRRLNKISEKSDLEDQYRKIAIWHSQNVSRKEMAERLGISVYTVNNRILALRKKGIITTNNKPGRKNPTDQILQLEEFTLKNGYPKKQVDFLIRLYIQEGLYKDAVMLLDNYLRNNNLSGHELSILLQIRTKLQSNILKQNEEKEQEER